MWSGLRIWRCCASDFFSLLALQSFGESAADCPALVPCACAVPSLCRACPGRLETPLRHDSPFSLRQPLEVSQGGPTLLMEELLPVSQSRPPRPCFREAACTCQLFPPRPPCCSAGPPGYATSVPARFRQCSVIWFTGTGKPGLAHKTAISDQ